MPRCLLITADDFGIGPDTSRGILDLAERGAITSTVLLVTSPYAEDGMRQWNQRGRPVELGWHPCLTLDAPILKPGDVPSLVDADGRFHPLGTLLKKLMLKRVDGSQIERELQAQHRRFLDLAGHAPRNVNGHHHVHIFKPVAAALARILKSQEAPYLRRVIESYRTLFKIPGALVKRTILSHFGRRMRRSFPGNDALLGITDPPYVHDPRFFANWLKHSRGDTLELTCHPGHLDATLDGRDGSLADGQLHRRAAEFARLSDPAFLAGVKAAGFKLVTGEMISQSFKLLRQQAA